MFKPLCIELLMSSLTEPCRCPWLNLSKPDYVAYHDQEWGVPVHDDALLFEYLVLESAQAGLSWYTILQKRETYRQAFDQFNAEKIAEYDSAIVESLMHNSGIIRNRLKILATIENAKQFLKIQQEYGSFDQFIWQFVNYTIKHNQFSVVADYPARSLESDAMSVALKKRGFKFMGSTTCYAFMQAVGMVNDHALQCFRRHALANS
jgi:DNA-3-methyladenine glycosylase I